MERESNVIIQLPGMVRLPPTQMDLMTETESVVLCLCATLPYLKMRCIAFPHLAYGRYIIGYQMLF